jgi:hypothetical protein
MTDQPSAIEQYKSLTPRQQELIENHGKFELVKMIEKLESKCVKMHIFLRSICSCGPYGKCTACECLEGE